MSKPVVRIILIFTVSLALIGGIYTTVLGLGSSHGVKVGQPHVTAGLLADLTHPRSAPALLDITPMKDGPGHDCEHDGLNPNDY